MKAKHILSYACDKACSYCINEHVPHSETQTKDASAIFGAYLGLRERGVSHLMLSGGEPVLNAAFTDCLRMASTLFEAVSVITAHRSALRCPAIEERADDVLFSIHHEYLETYDRLEVLISAPVYVSTVYETYLALEERVGGVEDDLRARGFSGLTVRELYPHGQPMPEGAVSSEHDDFSIRTYRKGNCEGEDLVLRPDLTLQDQRDFVTVGS